MKLLVAVDFSASVEHVIHHVRKLGTALNAKVWLLHAADPHPELVGHEAAPPKVRTLAAEEFHKEHRQLQQLGDELRDSGLDCVALLIQGQTVDTILAEAEKLGVDMIVLGSHGKGAIKRFFVGNSCEEVIKRSTRPVLVVPAHAGS